MKDERILFEDFFNAVERKEIKVKFNMLYDNKENAWDLLLDDDPKWIAMNAHRKTDRNNNIGTAKKILTFAKYYPYGDNFYIFGGIYDVKEKKPEILDGEGYDLTLTDEYAEYRKRLIIRLENPVGMTYLRWFERIQDSLNPEVYEIAPSTKLGTFPGYNKVRLLHKDLQRIINNGEPEWKNALSRVKGVYCITDISTGKLYIGSAYGEEGIWQRWSSYANVNDLTGGNKAFEDIKKNNGGYIIQNFSYSILEICDIKTDNRDVIQREEYWKKVFQSVAFGMNEVRRP